MRLSAIFSKLFFVFCVSLLVVQAGIAQVSFNSEEELIEQARKLFGDANYKDAKPLFSQLLSLHPEVSEYNYKFGVCKLVTDADKTEALVYLEAAIKLPDPANEAYYYLGRGYHINFRFDDAIAQYTKYKNGLGGAADPFEVDRKISMCQNGKQLYDKDYIFFPEAKNKALENEFFRKYDQRALKGKVIPKTDNFKTKYEKKVNEQSFMFVSQLSRELYFSGYGEEGLTGTDIYRVFKLPNGEWAIPQRLPDIINTKYDEAYAFMHPDGDTLYFSSKGHNTMGGYDIFMTVLDRETDTWSKPVNMEYPFNTPDDDIFYALEYEREFAYFATKNFTEPGKITVYKVAKHDPKNDLMVVKGNFSMSEDTSFTKVQISIQEKETGELKGIFNSNRATGNYLLALPRGHNYVFDIEPEGFVSHKFEMKIPSDADTTPILQRIQFIKDENGERIVLTNKFDDYGNFAEITLTSSLTNEQLAAEAAKQSKKVMSMQQYANYKAEKKNAARDYYQTLALAQNNIQANAGDNTATTNQEIGQQKDTETEAAKKAEEEKLALEAKQKEEARIAEEKAQAEAAKKAEEEKLALEAKQKEEARIAEEKAQAEAAKKAEEEKLALEAKQKEEARIAEEKAQAEAAKKAEEEKLALETKQKEEARIAEEKAQAEAAKKAEEEKLAQEKANKDAMAKAEAEKAEAAQLATQNEFIELMAKGGQAAKDKDYEAAHEYYAKASKLRPNEAFAKDKVKEMETLLAEAREEAEYGHDHETGTETKELTKEEQEANAEAAKRKVYDKLIADGDIVAKENKPELARQFYTEASKLYPDETLPKEKLKEIEVQMAEAEKLMAEQKEAAAQMEAKKQTEEAQRASYDDLIAKGDAALKEGKHELAKENYAKAEKIYPNNFLALHKKQEVEQLMAEQKEAAAQMEAKKQTEEAQRASYDDLIAKGDVALKEGKHELAKENYAKAEKIYPNNFLALHKIQEVDKLIAEKETLAQQGETKEPNKEELVTEEVEADYLTQKAKEDQEAIAKHNEEAAKKQAELEQKQKAEKERLATLAQKQKELEEIKKREEQALAEHKAKEEQTLAEKEEAKKELKSSVDSLNAALADNIKDTVGQPAVVERTPEQIEIEKKQMEEHLKAVEKEEKEKQEMLAKQEAEHLAAVKAQEEAEKKKQEEELAAKKEEERLTALQEQEQLKKEMEAAEKARLEELAMEEKKATEAEKNRKIEQEEAKRAEEERIAAEKAKKEEEARLAEEKAIKAEQEKARKAEGERTAAEKAKKDKEARLAAEKARQEAATKNKTKSEPSATTTTAKHDPYSIVEEEPLNLVELEAELLKIDEALAEVIKKEEEEKNAALLERINAEARGRDILQRGMTQADARKDARSLDVWQNKPEPPANAILRPDPFDKTILRKREGVYYRIEVVLSTAVPSETATANIPAEQLGVVPQELVTYTTGYLETQADVILAKSDLKDRGIKDYKIIAYHNDEEIPFSQAREYPVVE